MSLFRLNDKVWCLHYGEGTVYEIEESGCVLVKFPNRNCPIHYTSDGSFPDVPNRRSLYFSEPKIDALAERPSEPIFKINDLVLTFKVDDEKYYPQTLKVKDVKYIDGYYRYYYENQLDFQLYFSEKDPKIVLYLIDVKTGTVERKN